MSGIKLLGTGSAVPSKVVTNDDLAKIVDTNDEWISTRTGIRSRRYCAEGESHTSLCLAAARQALMDILSNYQGFRPCRVILVFDAYKVKGNPGSVERWHNIYVVYTREAETADTYIERATYEIARDHRVRVATSDSLEQLIILGHGAVRLSAREFKAEMEAVEGSIREIIARNNRTRGEENTLRRRAVIRGKTGGPPGGT